MILAYQWAENISQQRHVSFFPAWLSFFEERLHAFLSIVRHPLRGDDVGCHVEDLIVRVVTSAHCPYQLFTV